MPVTVTARATRREEKSSFIGIFKRCHHHHHRDRDSIFLQLLLTSPIIDSQFFNSLSLSLFLSFTLSFFLSFILSFFPFLSHAFSTTNTVVYPLQSTNSTSYRQKKRKRNLQKKFLLRRSRQFVRSYYNRNRLTMLFLEIARLDCRLLKFSRIQNKRSTRAVFLERAIDSLKSKNTCHISICSRISLISIYNLSNLSHSHSHPSRETTRVDIAHIIIISSFSRCRDNISLSH